MAQTETGSQPTDAGRSPSYPQRVHIRERAQWRALLADRQNEVRAVRRKFDTLPNTPKRDEYARLLAQMDGTLDQIADAVRRLPMEVGELYEEDRHRLEEAEKALKRLLSRWETV